jgi:hypothetical protein
MLFILLFRADFLGTTSNGSDRAIVAEKNAFRGRAEFAASRDYGRVLTAVNLGSPAHGGFSHMQMARPLIL